MGFVELLVPVLVFLNNSSNHYLERHGVVAASPLTPSSSIVVAGVTGGDASTASLYQPPVATTEEEVPSSSSSSKAAADDASYRVWDLPNGRVEFHNPFIFDGLTLRRRGSTSGQQILDSDRTTSSVSETSSIALWDPIFLGSGGSGAVFSFSTRPTSIHHTSNINNSLLDSSTNNDLKQQYAVNNKGGANGSEDRIAIKVSWKRSNASVLKECNILQTLSSVPHVERCLGRPMDYPYENGRSIIALSPVVVMDEAATTNSGGDITSSIDKVIPGLPQRNAVQCVVETMVQMLQLGVYTIDVQPLIHRTTGEVVFIDFTEADYFSTIGDGTEAAIVGFCGEMLTLIPECLKGIAVEMLTTEINDMKENNKSLSQTIVDILESSWLE